MTAVNMCVARVCHVCMCVCVVCFVCMCVCGVCVRVCVLLHEYIRYRDKQLTAFPRIVSPLWLGFEHNFEKVSTRHATTQGINYDYESIMHYSSTAFSRNGRPTILPLTTSVSPRQLGNRNGFTTRDLQHVNTLYRCHGRGEGGHIEQEG